MAVEALGPGVVAAVGVGPRTDSLASAAPAARFDVLTPLDFAMPACNEPLVVVVSAHVLNPGPLVHTINRGYNII